MIRQISDIPAPVLQRLRKGGAVWQNAMASSRPGGTNFLALQAIARIVLRQLRQRALAPQPGFAQGRPVQIGRSERKKGAVSGAPLAMAAVA